MRGAALLLRLACTALLCAGAWSTGRVAAAGPLPPVPDLQQSMALGEMSSEQLVRRALEAADSREFLNAFISLDRQGALDRARRLDALRRRGEILGALHGIPVAVKDNIHVSGLPSTAGTPLLESVVPREDAPVVFRLKAAGAIVLGKTNMHELAFGITSANAAYGAVGNARDPRLIAGGSSGGTAVAIASGMAVAGLGTDTGGSSRIPAALNGIVGFRPTGGRYPAAGLTRISSTRDTVGPMARTVADVALLDAILAGTRDEALPGVDLRRLRIGIPRGYFYDSLEAAVGESIENFLLALSKAGVNLVPADLDGIGPLNAATGFPIVLYEARSLLSDYLAVHLPGRSLQALVVSAASPDVRELLRRVERREVSDSDYRRAMEQYRPRLQRLYAEYFREHEVEAVLFPTTPLTARPIGDGTPMVELNGESVPAFATYIRNTDPGSNANIPGLSIPLAVPDGSLPVGVEIDGPEGSDRRLLAIGAAIERLLRRQAGVVDATTRIQGDQSELQSF